MGLEATYGCGYLDMHRTVISIRFRKEQRRIATDAKSRFIEIREEEMEESGRQKKVWEFFGTEENATHRAVHPRCEQ